MDKAQYNELVAKIADGGKVNRATYDEMVAFAKARKIKKPSEDAVIDEAAIAAAAVTKVEEPAKPAKKAKAAKEPKAPKEPRVAATCDPSTVESDEECSKPARSNGLCAAHYSRLVYRAKPENAAKAREASKAYAAKVRADKKAAAEAAEPELATA